MVTNLGAALLTRNLAIAVVVLAWPQAGFLFSRKVAKVILWNPPG